MARPSESASSSKDTSSPASGLRLFRIPRFPEIRRGDDLPKRIADSARKAGMHFEDGDILVIAQKIVSKAEGSMVRLAKVRPSVEAIGIAHRLKKDPRIIEVVLKESRRIVRSEHVLITETHHGFVCAPAIPIVPPKSLSPRSASEPANASPSSLATLLAAPGASA